MVRCDRCRRLIDIEDTKLITDATLMRLCSICYREYQQGLDDIHAVYGD